MKQPLLHPRTSGALQRYLKRPTHGLLLLGEDAIGKYYIATWLAKQQSRTQYTVKADEGKSSISIEQIRELYNLTRTDNKLIVIIKDAHQLGIEAQNAFLKLLEEPPKNTLFILTAHSTDKILSTILSRCQNIDILPPKQSDLIQRATESAPDIQNLPALISTTRGLPGKLFILLNSTEKVAEHANSVDEAKTFYAATPYKRHIICVERSYDKVWVQTLLDLLATITAALLKANANSTAALTKLQNQATLIEETSIRIFTINGNPKIHLARLCEKL